ncbi:MAG: MATE family efflux transporter [Butyrivibrio sp.]|nr:MATE family efflux transporter [Butyrivibrio sp.]
MTEIAVKKKSRTKLDMTQGSIMKLVVLFALPIIASNVLQQLYTIVDTLIIGNFCGPQSIAAIGTSSQPIEVFMCVFMGIGAGVSILVSMYTGSKDDEALGKTVKTSISFTYLCAIPLSILGIVLTPVILKFMNVPEDTWDLAVLYIRIVFLGLLGTMGYNMNAGILRGLGDSSSTLLFLIISSVTNIVLDIVFVAGFHMDVGGAAVATIISMYLAWIASVVYVMKKYPQIGFTFLPKSLDGKSLSDILKMGLPLGFNNSIYTVGHILMQSLINMQGSGFMAGASVAGKIMGVSSVAITSFSSAMSTFAGQNYGAKLYARLRKGGKIVPVYSAAITISLGVIMYIFAEPLIRCFTDDPEAIKYAMLCVHIQVPFQWCYCVLNTILNLSNGIGAVKYSTIVNLLMLWAVRIPSAYLIAIFFDGHYVTGAVSISFIFGMIASLLFYRSRNWKKIKDLEMAQSNMAFS